LSANGVDRYRSISHVAQLPKLRVAGSSPVVRFAQPCGLSDPARIVSHRSPIAKVRQRTSATDRHDPLDLHRQQPFLRLDGLEQTVHSER
jgi:hypothetical protein